MISILYREEYHQKILECVTKNLKISLLPNQRDEPEPSSSHLESKEWLTVILQLEGQQIEMSVNFFSPLHSHTEHYTMITKANIKSDFHDLKTNFLQNLCFPSLLFFYSLLFLPVLPISESSRLSTFGLQSMQLSNSFLSRELENNLRTSASRRRGRMIKFNMPQE